MSFDSIRSQLSNPSWLKIPRELIHHRGVVNLTKKESRSLLQDARNAINDGRLQEAQNALYAGLLLDEERFLYDVQKAGLLRISRFSYVAGPLTSLVTSLLVPELNLGTDVYAYLKSVRNLYRIAESVRAEYEQIREWLEEERERGIRGLLSTLDLLFLRRAFEPFRLDPSQSSRDPRFYSVEGLAAGLSAVLALYFNEFGPLRGNVLVDAEAVVAGECLELLIAGAHLDEFREWEFLVDRFGYRIEQKGSSSEFRLTTVFDDMHRAIEYGYIQNDMQMLAKSQLWHDPDTASFVDIGQRYSDKCMVHVEEPLPRYRFEFPDVLFSYVAGVKEFTQEEQKTITWACREMSVSPEELFEFDFGNGVTINDLFRVSRVVNFMHGVAASKLRDELEDCPEIVVNSLVPAIPVETLTEIVAKVIGDNKANTVVDLLMLRPDRHIDVLYTPLIPAGKTVLLPVHVFSQSNVFRNPLMFTQQRLFPDGTFDPLTNQVAECFEKVGAAVLKSLSYSWNGETGECDVVALLDDHLFVFECKNSLLPTGVHELRTSLDYIEKAAGQLDRFTRLFKDSGFQEWLSKQLGQAITGDTKLLTSIIVSNRMFLGMRLDGISVRGNQELEHFMTSGTVEFVDTGVFEASSTEIRLWNGEEFSVEDLVRYFDEDLTYVPHWASMETFVSKFEFFECEVEVARYRLNFIALAGNLGCDDLKRKMIQKAKAEGIPIDDEGWFIPAAVERKSEWSDIVSGSSEESRGE